MSATLSQSQPGPDRLKVAWIAGDDTFAKMGRTLKPLAIGLMGEMIDVVLLVPARADVREVPSPPVEMIDCPPAGWFRPAKGRASVLAEELARRGVHLVHGLAIAEAELTKELADLCSVPHVVSCHTFGGASQLHRDAPCPDVVLASGDIIAAQLQDALRLPSDQIRIVRPGVYQNGQVTCFADPSRIASIVIDGRGGNFGALEAAVRAFAEARRRDIDCACFLIGAERLEKRLRKLGETLQVRQELTFVDPPTISQMPGILSGADIYIVPRAGNEVNLWALMSMAAGTVVLAADAPEDFFIDGQTAYLFGGGDMLDLADKLIAVLTDHATARQVARQAVEHVQTHHSPADMVATVVEIYRGLSKPAGRYNSDKITASA